MELLGNFSLHHRDALMMILLFICLGFLEVFESWERLLMPVIKFGDFICGDSKCFSTYSLCFRCGR